MATTKKTPVKTTTAKATTRKKAVSSKTKKRRMPSIIRGSFTIQAEKQPFLSFRLTDQTLYWAIFAVTVLVLGLWVLKLHLAVEEIYDQIDLNMSSYETQSPVTAKPSTDPKTN